MNSEKTYIGSLISGGIAGTTVDMVLYPLDTLKTRLQSESPVSMNKNLYKGISSNLLGSFPSAALFFVTYDGMKRFINENNLIEKPYITHMIAASFGEISSCTFRVPNEVIKQRLQTHQYKTLTSAIMNCYKDSGISGFYRGYISTIIREIPFTCVQFPLYEFFKKKTINKGLDKYYHLCICGSVSAAIAAAVTTPLDVIKTHTILNKTKLRYLETINKILISDGIKGLFKGIIPRVLWLSFGGSIFLGSYEFFINKF